MKDLMYSAGLEDQLNFESDFDTVPVTFGQLKGRLSSVTDIQVNNTVMIEFVTTSTWDALSMLRGDYPDNVIIRYGGKNVPIEIKVNSFRVSRDNGVTVIQVGGEYVKKEK